MRCARSGQHLPRHRVSGAYELRKRVRPDGAALFLHRPSGVRELPQAGSPFPGGKFSLNLSGGDAVPTAVGKKEGQPAVFLPL